MLAAVAPCALLLSTRPPAWFGPVGSGSVETAAAALPAHENGVYNWKLGSYFNVSRYLLWRVMNAQRRGKPGSNGGNTYIAGPAVEHRPAGLPRSAQCFTQALARPLQGRHAAQAAQTHEGAYASEILHQLLAVAGFEVPDHVDGDEAEHQSQHQRLQCP